MRIGVAAVTPGIDCSRGRSWSPNATIFHDESYRCALTEKERIAR